MFLRNALHQKRNGKAQRLLHGNGF
jgi:hypothetical protein